MSIRVFVQVWCEIDPSLNVRLDRQSGKPVPECGDDLLRVSPLGQAGVASALQLGSQSVTAFALGIGHTVALRHALAAGVSRAVQLTAAGADPEIMALPALAQWLREQQADLVIADRQSGLIAAQLGWAHLAGLADLKVRSNVLHACRFLDRGAREAVKARLPAAVRLHDTPARAGYVSRARIQAVAGRVVEEAVLPSEEIARVVAGPLQAARARTRLGLSPPPAASANSRLQALMGSGRPGPVATNVKPAAREPPTLEEMAEEFVRYLKHHDLLPDG